MVCWSGPPPPSGIIGDNASHDPKTFFFLSNRKEDAIEKHPLSPRSSSPGSRYFHVIASPNALEGMGDLSPSPYDKESQLYGKWYSSYVISIPYLLTIDDRRHVHLVN